MKRDKNKEVKTIYKINKTKIKRECKKCMWYDQCGSDDCADECEDYTYLEENDNDNDGIETFIENGRIEFHEEFEEYISESQED